jgi:mannose-6-phosphate isomerase-like protein (cupin superfamily)
MDVPAEHPPYALSRHEGKAIWFLDTLMTVKAGAEATRNGFTLIECVLPPGFAPPPHVHHGEEEAFYILEGQLAVTCGGRTWQVGPGSFVFLPRGITHTFRVEGSEVARALQITAPAGFERFAEEVGEPARAPTVPPPASPDLEKLMAAAAKHNIQIEAPPLGQ